MASKYTQQLQDILCDLEGLTTLQKVVTPTQNIIDNGIQYFFNFNHNWYCDLNETKQDFYQKFLYHYYSREIAFETFGMFRTKLADKINMQMETYSKIFNEYSKNMNLLDNVYMDSTHKDITQILNKLKQDTNRNQTNDSTVNNETINSDNPQVTISHDYASSMTRGENKATNKNVESNNTKAENTQDTDRDLKEHSVGRNNQSLVRAVKELQEKYIAINTELVLSCSDLFLKVY